MYPQGQPHPQYPGYPNHPGQPYADPYGGYGQATVAQQSAAGQYPALYHGPYTSELASWGQRAGAYLIDYVIQMVLVFAVIAGVIGLAALSWELTDPEGAGGHNPPAVFIIIMLLTYPAAFATMFCYRWLPHAKSGRTVGKRVMGIRLVKAETGQPMGKGPAAGRELIMYVLSFATCGIGSWVDLLWPLWDDRNQTLHDKVVNGVVIRD